jgi:KaiC/GvpD/RAD55 family RecA-like ATPase
MNTEKQRLMLTYLMSNDALFTKANQVLQASFFDVELKKAIEFIKRYHKEYHSLPSPDQLFVESNVRIEPKPLAPQEVSYAENELEAFCKYKASEAAIFKAVELIQDGREGEIVKLMQDAVAVGFHREIGTDYFNNPEARLHKLAETSAATPTGIKKLDEALAGGLNRKEMIIFAAPSGVGKSITMSNVARNLVLQGFSGIYISLELSEEMVSKRFDSMFTGMAQGEVLKNITKVAQSVEQVSKKPGQFVVKRMPESVTNANNIRAYLKEYETLYHRIPDFIVVDYIDIMASIEKVSVENSFVKDKYVTEELRSIANDYNLMMISASQLNRGAQQIEALEDLNQGHIAGGISKINTTDNLVAILQTPQMKARGELMFKMLKTRSSGGVGSYFMVKFNSYNLRITDLEDDSESRPTLANRISSFRRSKTSENGKEEASPNTNNVTEIKSPPKPTLTIDSLFQV